MAWVTMAKILALQFMAMIVTGQVSKPAEASVCSKPS